MSESAKTENSTDIKQDETSVKETNKQVCAFYRKKSGCRFGKKCRNLHENPGEKKKSSTSDAPEDSEKSSDVVNASTSAEVNSTDSASAPAEPVQNDVSVSAVDKKQENEVNGSESEVFEESQENDGEVKEGDSTAPLKKVCVYYRRGYCQFGSRCRYLHSRGETKSAKQRSKSTSSLKDDKTNVEKPTTSAPENGEKPKEEKVKDAPEVKQRAETLQEKKQETTPRASAERVRSQSESQANQPRDKQICKFYFGPAGCRFGQKCRNSHDLRQVEAPPSPVAETPPPEATRRTSEPSRKSSTGSLKGQGKKAKNAVVQPQTTFLLNTLNETELVKLRTSEVEQLMKRYPRCREARQPDGTVGYYVKFIPSDPDWVSFPDKWRGLIFLDCHARIASEMFGTKLLPELMLTYNQSDPMKILQGQTSQK